MTRTLALLAVLAWLMYACSDSLANAIVYAWRI